MREIGELGRSEFRKFNSNSLHTCVPDYRGFGVGALGRLGVCGDETGRFAPLRPASYQIAAPTKAI
ncbi:MAG: hypothetical protein ACMG55_13000, partial [Microcoleus sp.]